MDTGERKELVEKLTKLADGLLEMNKLGIEQQKWEEVLVTEDEPFKQYSFWRFYWIYLVVGVVISYITSFLSEIAGYIAGGAAIGVAVIGFIIALAVIIGGIYLAKKTRDAKNAELSDQLVSSNDNLGAQKNRAVQRLDEIKKQIKELGTTLLDVVDVIPDDYCYYEAVTYIRDCLRNWRADSMKEALNLYEEQLHRWKLEQSARDQAEYQRIMTQYEAENARNIKAIRTSTAISAATNVANLLRN